MTTPKKAYHIVYPHQLFEEVFSLPKDVRIVVVEDPLFFCDKKYPRRFHKQKLVLHRASLRAFADALKKKGRSVTYVDYAKYPDPFYVADLLAREGASAVSVFDPTDFILEKRIRQAFAKKGIQVDVLESPNFVTPRDVAEKFFAGKKKFLMNSFYIFQRKRLGVLVDENGTPAGGKWSFDVENRKKLPKGIDIPKNLVFKHDEYVREAIQYVNAHFKENPGNGEDFNYPVHPAEAKKLLADFLKNKLAHFGAYEDAISQKEAVIFHSVLSAPLNIGLLSPHDIVEAAMQCEGKVPLASLEGFVRQIIGWREFMRVVYLLKGTAMRNGNALHHRNPLPASWYEGTTGVLPVDDTIKKVLKNAYCHHIERLMVVGNFMLLCQIRPDDVYGWFMDLFIDAYDWVMVPNVYAMSQFADGGTITTKPYFSSSNYILKMSDYPKGEWCGVWDALFYAFLAKHRAVIFQNPRLRVLIRNLDALSEQKKSAMSALAKKYL